MCIIDHKNKIIFIAIPKTATTSIQHFFEKNFPNCISINENIPNDIGLVKHSTALEIKNIIKQYDDYHSFTIIRNPFDWYISWYTYAKDPLPVVDSRNKTLKEFIDFYDYLNKDLMSYLVDDDGKIIVNTIIKYEDGVDNEINKLMKKLRIKINYPLDKLNISKFREEKNYKKYYDEETINIVKKIQSKTLEFFKYDF